MTLNDKKDITEKSTGKRVFRIGCLALLTIFATLLLIIGIFIFWVFHKITIVNNESSKQHAVKMKYLNVTRISGLNDFDIAFEDCDVYRATKAKSDWRKVNLRYGNSQYPKILTGCTHADTKIEGEWFYVNTCAQAIGAGGGCARFGTFRTSDGEHWFRREGSDARVKWIDALSSNDANTQPE